MNASPRSFYLGCYTKPGGSLGILQGTLDDESGQISKLTVAAEIENPSYVALSPDEKYAYASLEAGEGTLAAFRREADGSLVFLNQVPSGGGGACHVWADEKHVFVANYGGGNTAGFERNPDGSLGKCIAFFQYEGTGPHPTRQKGPHAHSAFVSPDQKHLYVCDLGTDKVMIYDFAPETGTVTPASEPFAKVPPAGGPRHVAFHPEKPVVYCNNEMGLAVTVFARDEKTGALTEMETISTLSPEANPEGTTTAAIACHPNGKWLYVSNRGHNSIAVFAINEEGRLKLAETVPSEVDFPRGFAIDPTGKWLLVAGQKDERLTAFAIDLETGSLKPTGQFVEAGVPVCVTFAHKP